MKCIEQSRFATALHRTPHKKIVEVKSTWICGMKAIDYILGSCRSSTRLCLLLQEQFIVETEFALWHAGQVTLHQNLARHIRSENVACTKKLDEKHGDKEHCKKKQAVLDVRMWREEYLYQT